MITITRSSFRLGIEQRRALIIFLGWWWVCIGSWGDRMADVAESNERLRRNRHEARRLDAMGREWRRRGR